jgi:ABC-type multidrug transport system fused ATPase/permease subunit
VHGSRSAAAFYAGAYLLCCATNATLAVARTQYFCAGGAAAAGCIFQRAAAAVMRAPLLFFETTPTGRILNRLTGDQDVLDTTLPVVFLRLSASMSWALSALAIMCGVVPPAALVCGLAIAAYALGVSRFAAAYAQLQRLDANTRSPLQVHVQESLTGAPVIRASGATFRFVDGCDARCDASARATAAFTLAGRCFAVRLETLGAAVLLSVGVCCSLLAQRVGAPLAGLALLWGTNFTTSLSFFTQSLTDFQSKIVSVERLLAYAQLAPEPLWDDEHEDALAKAAATKAAPACAAELAAAPLRRARVQSEAPAGWPCAGALSFDQVTLCYRPGLPPALRELSFSVQPGERLGIVGRTGAGKSTIAAALLRLRELSGGVITLDGVDLSTLPLATVRGRGVCALPQEPLLLTGSVRDNLVLTSAAAEGDASIWAALEAVRMRAAVARLPSGLDAAMADAGGNFSAGERQLLCFARALLRRPRLLLLDEATASTDEASDAAIQQALRAGFGDVTVLAIAHRIGTIIDYDRTAVMSGGRLAELGTPAELLADEHSAFSALVHSMGPAAAAALREAAAAAARASCPDC